MTSTPEPVNEPVRDYAPGSPERAQVARRLTELAAERHELTLTIAGTQRVGSGEPIEVVQPHDHGEVLGELRAATNEDTSDAIAAAKDAFGDWSAAPFDERAAVFLKAAALLAGPWRDTLNAATMLGQSKTVHQAEIDAACELIDFWRFNVAFARQLMEDQPLSAPGTWDRTDYRPLEGFVLAITPFNFTSIAGNLPTAPALMGNTVVWKPSSTQQLAAHYTMRLLEAAGLPPGVVNLVTGPGPSVSEVAIGDRDLAGIHFTGSTATFRHLWRSVGERIEHYRSFPRLVGETGGKNFVLVHPSAEPDVVRTALIRGAFEYQGQKCSAVSRAYIPQTMWRRLEHDLVEEAESLAMGDIRDFTNFLGAVIDKTAFDRLTRVIEAADHDAALTRLTSRLPDGRRGWFVPPTLYRSDDPKHSMFVTEHFGPVLAIFVYEDDAFDEMLPLVDRTAPYGLTGAVIGTDRVALERAERAFRFTAGNFYVNDKPTGAVVGQQPFGGARASGTNDKAGSLGHLLRWVSPRVVKENFAPPTDSRYPFMGPEPTGS